MVLENDLMYYLVCEQYVVWRKISNLFLHQPNGEMKTTLSNENVILNLKTIVWIVNKNSRGKLIEFEDVCDLWIWPSMKNSI